MIGHPQYPHRSIRRVVPGICVVRNWVHCQQIARRDTLTDSVAGSAIEHNALSEHLKHRLIRHRGRAGLRGYDRHQLPQSLMLPIRDLSPLRTSRPVGFL